MKKGSFKIGWQKYEDIMEEQLSSPLITSIMQNMMLQNMENVDEDDEESLKSELLEHSHTMPSIVPISEQLLEEITMLSNFDCWMAHTNFDITPKIKEQLNKIQGIEVLKVCSRYRFFIGVGKMFNFSEVRKNIEKDILPS
jgi:hypothetical protein